MIRGDLSNCLIHLTRGVTDVEAGHAFQSILASKELRGSDLDIRGKYKCVCFSEAPISVLAQALALPPLRGLRYAPFGVMVRKEWLFALGGRPVIYQPEQEYELLHERSRFRHVRYNPVTGPDHTWEREWRIQAAALPLDLAEVTFVVPTRAWEEKFLEKHAGEQRDQAYFNGKNAAFSIERPAWHFIALEDLGLKFTSEVNE